MDKKVRKQVLQLSIWAAAMFGFAMFLMPPLYTMFCDLIGVNQEFAKYEAQAVDPVDEDRTVKVQFVAANQATMPWEFKPLVFEVEVHPGVRTEVHFYAHNRTRRDMIGQAIPSLIPYQAADYFHKTECFCFSNQALRAGEEAELPLVFIVDRDLPESVNVITLSYTMFDVTGRVPEPAEWSDPS
jgi:cytochrome c oxidase assembly protein subunit 11